MSNKQRASTPIIVIGLVLVAFGISGSAINPADIYLPQLKDSNADIRIAALRQLLTLLDSRIPEAMLPLLSDEGDSIRRLAARAIGSRWWQIPEAKRADYLKTLSQNVKSELEDERNMADRAIGLLSRKYEGKMFARSANRRWVVYERRGLPCLIDTQTGTEELVGWPPNRSLIELLMPAVGNGPLTKEGPDGPVGAWLRQYHLW